MPLNTPAEDQIPLATSFSCQNHEKSLRCFLILSSLQFMIVCLSSLHTQPSAAKASRRSALGRFLFTGSRLDVPERGEHTHPWYLVLWLTGVDYFSTLGYAPGIALIAAGVLCLPATGVLVLVTIFGAFPIYAEVAARSYAGQGALVSAQRAQRSYSIKRGTGNAVPVLP